MTTNLGFLLDALGREEFQDGTADTDWVESAWIPRVPELPEGVHAAGEPGDPWVAFGAGAGDGVRDVTIAGSHAQYRGWAYRLADELVATDAVAPRGSLTSPMPATVLRVDVTKGDEVAAGQVVAVLEAMKIQVQVTAPTTGTVRAVRARVGDLVAKGDTLIEMEEP